MKKIIAIISIFLFTLTLFSQNNSIMAYYTDLSEIIDGEEYMSIYTFKNKFVLMEGRLNGMTVSDIEKRLENLGIESKYSSVKIDEMAMLEAEDSNPAQIYPLSALMNVNGVITIADLEIVEGNKILKLNSKGQLFINEILVATITKDFKIVDLDKNTLASVINKDVLSLLDGDFQITLKNNELKTLVKIENDGSFKIGKKIVNWDTLGRLSLKGHEVKLETGALKSELFQTASLLYYVFFKEKLINLEAIFKAKLHQVLGEEININYGLKIRKDLWTSKKVEQVIYHVEEVLVGNINQVSAKQSRITNTKDRVKYLYDTLKTIEVYIPLNYKKILTELEYNNLIIKVFQARNINIWIKNGKLKKSLGDDGVDKAVVNKLQLDGMYNISFNYAFLNGEQISNIFYSTKTSLLNRRKSIPNKKNKRLDMDRYNPRKTY